MNDKELRKMIEDMGNNDGDLAQNIKDIRKNLEDLNVENKKLEKMIEDLETNGKEIEQNTWETRQNIREMGQNIEDLDMNDEIMGMDDEEERKMIMETRMKMEETRMKMDKTKIMSENMRKKTEEVEKRTEEAKKRTEEAKKRIEEAKKKSGEFYSEHRLWDDKKTNWNPSAISDLHKTRMLDGIISDKSSLYPSTLCSREEFQYILDLVDAHATASGDMPLFRDSEFSVSDPKNKCKIPLRHALLLALFRKQGNGLDLLCVFFGIDQTSACRYLEVMDRILAAVLPTARNVSEEIAACKTNEEFKGIVPGLEGGGGGGGDVFVDGMHCPVLRPSEKTLKRMVHSGKKKKQFTHDTNVYTNADGVIIGISKSLVGSAGDLTLFKEDSMPFGKWAESMRDDSTLEEDRIRVWSNWNYQVTGKDLPGATLMIPSKKTKNNRILTAKQKEHNHLVHSARVPAGRTIGRLKRYERLTRPYDGTASQFNHEFNVITGLANLHLLWDRIDRDRSRNVRATSVDWDRTVSHASSTSS